MTDLFQVLHSPDIKTQVNEAQVAPETVFKYPVGLSVSSSNQLKIAVSKYPAEASLAFLAVKQQHSAHIFVSPGDACKVFKNALFVVNHLVVAKNI